MPADWRCFSATATVRFSLPSMYAMAQPIGNVVPGTSTGTASSTWPSSAQTAVVSAARKWRWHLPAASHVHGGRRELRSSQVISTVMAALDLATSGFNGVSVLLGNGDGTFRVLPLSGVSGELSATGDWNGDGRTDLAEADYQLHRRLDPAEQWRRNLRQLNPPTRWRRARATSSRATGTATAVPTWPTVANFTGDVSVLLGNGDGTFQPAANLLGRRRSDGPVSRAT